MPMNEKKALLVVSFGTSYVGNCDNTIGAVEQALREAFPQYEVRRAFTSGMIRSLLQKRDGITVDSVAEALEKLAQDGMEEVIVQPTHIMNGEEYDAMIRAVMPYENRFSRLCCGNPVLTEIEDYQTVAHVLMEDIPEWKEEGTAVVLMGHGTCHHANSAYAALEYRLHDEGCTSMFVGTVEGYPDLDAVVRKVKLYPVKKVMLYPFMIAAGDHVTNDMAGDEPDSWKSTFEKLGYEAECVLKGLGEYEGIRKIFIQHAGAAMDR